MDSSNNNTKDGSPHDMLDPSFVDLFAEEAPPEWTVEDMQALSAICGSPTQEPAPFQSLPVELVEHIAYNLVQFRDIRALAGTCVQFQRILFDSANHLFWYRWAKAPHSQCRWDLGVYRRNRAYQNTIVNQQSGRRRKRCQICMARALNGMAFKMKICMDCWEDVGLPANRLFFFNSVNFTGIPRQYVHDSYLEAEDNGSRREWALLYFFKPGALRNQFEQAIYGPNLEERPQDLIRFTRDVFNHISTSLVHIQRTMGWRFSSHYHYNDRTRRDKWYAAHVDDLISPHEVIQRALQRAISARIGKDWKLRGPYVKLPPASQLYGEGTEFQAQFPKTKCELQKTEEYVREFGEDPDNFHKCDVECERQKRAAMFKKIYWPQAEERLLRMLIGESAIRLTPEEVEKFRPDTAPRRKSGTQEIVDKGLAACKWLIPELDGDYIALPGKSRGQ
ncbi:hypothetical protein DRE_01251 [Drechslerella stenobrocha 248]|uniref:F-box domain-containing protein n=1 Tax=Drechslerella stenobrocha 248 TaxID=1043628 RepID=W7HLF5_9PEZI|nr:hypothetical protein DRE_01251 [Drechslerella stenobrocha 248]